MSERIYWCDWCGKPLDPEVATLEGDYIFHATCLVEMDEVENYPEVQHNDGEKYGIFPTFEYGQSPEERDYLANS